jgi:hypothetical protein
LNPRHFIGTDGMRTFNIARGGFQIGGTHFLYLRFKDLRIGFGRIQPIATAMGLEFSLALKNAPPDGGKYFLQSHA